MYIKESKIINNKLTGVAAWTDENEDDEQEFAWYIPADISSLPKIQVLCDYLVQNRLIYGDRIKISPEELIAALQRDGWNYYEAEKAIDDLQYTNVFMVDDGKENDSFFVHF